MTWCAAIFGGSGEGRGEYTLTTHTRTYMCVCTTCLFSNKFTLYFAVLFCSQVNFSSQKLNTQANNSRIYLTHPLPSLLKRVKGALCPDVALNPFGHHAVTCRHGGDVVILHNRLWNVFLSFLHQAHIVARLEGGSFLTPRLDHTRLADVLVWEGPAGCGEWPSGWWERPEDLKKEPAGWGEGPEGLGEGPCDLCIMGGGWRVRPGGMWPMLEGGKSGWSAERNWKIKWVVNEGMGETNGKVVRGVVKEAYLGGWPERLDKDTFVRL